MAINPTFLAAARPEWDVPALLEGLKRGDRQVLARAITLVESRRDQDRAFAQELLDQLEAKSSSETFRIGITGNPGAGKSTLIEVLGQHWIAQGHRVAVLAIDPSSPQNHGSLLGDKTRMDGLSRAQEAFIRPSPSAGTLGGLHSAMPEVIALCEAAGYDRILVETVGVGQNETAVTEVVDFTLLVAMPGAGDEVQGLKRGVMEAADAVYVNKADGERLSMACDAQRQLRQALQLFHREDGWEVSVSLGTALEPKSLTDLIETLDRGMRWFVSTGKSEQRRKAQRITHLEKCIQEGLLGWANSHARQNWSKAKKAVKEGKSSPRTAALEFLRHLTSQDD